MDTDQDDFNDLVLDLRTLRAQLLLKLSTRFLTEDEFDQLRDVESRLKTLDPHSNFIENA